MRCGGKYDVIEIRQILLSMPLSSDHLATKHCGPIGWFSMKKILPISLDFVMRKVDILISRWIELER